MSKMSTLSQILEETREKMCNDYCRWPHEWDEEKEGCELIDSDVCINCPLNRL